MESASKDQRDVIWRAVPSGHGRATYDDDGLDERIGCRVRGQMSMPDEGQEEEDADAPAKLQSSPVIITVRRAAPAKHRYRQENEHRTSVHEEDALIMPTHHSGDLRYATPCPASPGVCERRRPFFLNTKLEPMSTPETMASIMPTTCGARVVV